MIYHACVGKMMMRREGGEDDVAMICVSIMVDSAEEVEGALAAARTAMAAESPGGRGGVGVGARLVEWRVDHLIEDVAAIERLVRESPAPSIVTCRSKEEGGGFDGAEALRISMIEHVGLEARPAYLDLELATYERSANIRQKVNLVIEHAEQVRPVQTRLILSVHDEQGRPTDLYQKIVRMAGIEACAVMKVAWRARSVRDNLEAFEILRTKTKPTIAVLMGEFGLMSRVLAGKFGGFLIFARPAGGMATAPGQPTTEELIGKYRFGRIGAGTKVYGVIGWPVGHSISPAVHNAAFEAAGFDGVYLPLPVPAEYEHFKATVGELVDYRALDFRGASVTIPHKEHLLRFVLERGGEVDESAAEAGAANTLIVQDDGGIKARNTDVAAIVESIAGAIGVKAGNVLRERRVAVMGTGGTARAAAAGLAKAGANVVVYGRRVERAEAVAREVTAAMSAGASSRDADDGARGVAMGKVVGQRLEKLCSTCCDVYVNATPVGMAGGPEPKGVPVPGGAAGVDELKWGAETVVVDAVYAPEETEFIRLARERGCRVVTGMEIFVRQAAAQSELWTGVRPDVEKLRPWALDALASADLG